MADGKWRLGWGEWIFQFLFSIFLDRMDEMDVSEEMDRRGAQARDA